MWVGGAGFAQMADQVANLQNLTLFYGQYPISVRK